MKNKLQLIPACIAAIALCAPAIAATESKTSTPDIATSRVASKAATPAAKNTTERAVPFHGMISAADQKAKTFTIAGKEKSRVFKITDTTVLTKAGAAATMKDIAVNEEVRGSYWKAADGSLEARTVKLGPLTEAEKAASQSTRRRNRRSRKRLLHQTPRRLPSLKTGDRSGSMKTRGRKTYRGFIPGLTPQQHAGRLRNTRTRAPARLDPAAIEAMRDELSRPLLRHFRPHRVHLFKLVARLCFC